MIAAISARKSTDQAGGADEQKSVVRQVEPARVRGSARDRSLLVRDGGTQVAPGTLDGEAIGS